jgi:hypothetical protein
MDYGFIEKRPRPKKKKTVFFKPKLCRAILVLEG